MKLNVIMIIRVVRYIYIYVDPEDSGLCLRKEDAFLNACTAASVIVGRSRFQSIGHVRSPPPTDKQHYPNAKKRLFKTRVLTNFVGKRPQTPGIWFNVLRYYAATICRALVKDPGIDDLRRGIPGLATASTRSLKARCI